MAPSRSTLVIASCTNTDWSNNMWICMPGGAAFWIAGSAALTRLTTSSVEASPFLIIVSSTERFPSALTMFCCTDQPSRTCATSDR
jgi:hypothetical protein